MKYLIVFIVKLSLLLGAFASQATSLSVSTNHWAPYINEKNQPLGSAADILRQVLSQEQLTINWRYQHYELAFALVANNQQPAAFPYFKTAKRQQQVLYSAPIFSVVSKIYYNRQGESKLNMEQLADHKFGRVAGYSYGEVIDAYLNDAKIFTNEKAALASLLNNNIDFLPMTESVMNTLLNQDYRVQALLIKHLDNIVGQDSLHLIAPKTAQGTALIAKVNQLLAQVANINSLQPATVKRFKPKDIARLIPAEGYPAIVGQVALTKATQYYTLPQGTRVLILRWSDKIIQASKTDRLYKSMVDLSQVVVLNGPHVGKELYIKNMYLEIQ